MALDTTVGGSAAESYLSVAEADVLAAQSLSAFAADWTAATETRKENALRQATRDIDTLVPAFDLYADDQALRFPRAVDLDASDVPYLVGAIRQATYEQASFLLATQTLRDQATKRRARGMFNFSEDDGPSGTIAVDPQLGRYSPEAQRLVRAVVATSTGGAASGSVRILTEYNLVDQALS